MYLSVKNRNVCINSNLPQCICSLTFFVQCTCVILSEHMVNKYLTFTFTSSIFLIYSDLNLHVRNLDTALFFSSESILKSLPFIPRQTTTLLLKILGRVANVKQNLPSMSRYGRGQTVLLLGPVGSETIKALKYYTNMVW